MLDGAPRPGAQSQGLADRLLAEGLIRPELAEKAVSMQRRTQKRIEECLLEIAAIREPDLLRYLASHYRTRFVSTEKLSKVSLDAGMLQTLPRKVAERYRVVPVLYDGATNTLSVVTSDPDNVEALDAIQKLASVREVKALVARPAAIDAAIKKLYLNDTLAFAAFERAESAVQFDLGGIVATGGSEMTQSSSGGIELDMGDDGPFRGRPAGAAPQARAAPPPSPGAGAAFTLGELGPAPAPARGPAKPAPPAPKPATTLGSMPPAAKASQSVRPARISQPVPAPKTDAAARRDWTTSDVFIETLNVLVTLLENGRVDLRGHSAQVARLTRKMAERIGLAAQDVNALVVAAYLHDLGKAGNYHLTALNASEYDGPRAGAQKAHANPYRLLQNLRLAPMTIAALESMYERFDGNGLPDQKSGKEIPLGSRLLAITDTFVDLTTNVRNPFRRILKPNEACDVLGRYKETIFDGGLVDLVRVTVAGDDLRARILADRPVALLVDPDPEETTVLELRMIEQGFEVRVARTTEQAKKMLATDEIELVVSEIDLGQSGEDGLSLLASARQAEWGRELPWLILSRRQGRADAETAFALGVIDYMLKPAPAEVLVAKLKQVLDKRAGDRPQRGVSGSLTEMGIPDLVQILFYGRKSGALRLRHGADTGDIFFAEGMVVDAGWGKLRGEDAVYALLHLHEGDFAFDPGARAEKTTITASPESLLLEGMRRMDEA